MPFDELVEMWTSKGFMREWWLSNEMRIGSEIDKMYTLFDNEGIECDDGYTGEDDYLKEPSEEAKKRALIFNPGRESSDPSMFVRGLTIQQTNWNEAKNLLFSAPLARIEVDMKAEIMFLF